MSLELKKLIQQGMKTKRSSEELNSFLSRQHSHMNNLQFSKSVNSTVWDILPFKFTILTYKGFELCIYGDEAPYSLVGLPVPLHECDGSGLTGILKELDNLGVYTLVSEKDLSKLLPEETKVDHYVDNYIYYWSELENYFTEKASRQSKKNDNRLNRAYDIEVILKEEFDSSTAALIDSINAKWLHYFKNDNKDYEYLIGNTSDVILKKCSGSEINPQTALILYKNRETGEFEAYDFIEAYGDTVYGVSGKSLIKDINVFKTVNINILKVANTLWGCKSMCLMPASWFRAKDKKPMASEGLIVSKSSLPHEREFLAVLGNSIDKWNSFSEDNGLF